MAVTTRHAGKVKAPSPADGGSASTTTNTSVATGSVFCILLALQYGLQPFLKVFIAKDVKKGVPVKKGRGKSD